MRVIREELPDRQVKLVVEVEDERAQDALRQTARRLSHKVRIPGFRPGKAPYHLVVNSVGEDYLRAETFDAIGQKLYEQALEEAEVDAYAQGSLEDVQWEPLTFKVTVPLAPAVELGDYKSLSVPREPVLVLDEDVDEALQEIRQRFATWTPVDRPSQDGDMLIMDITGTVNGEDIMSHQNWERVLRIEETGSLPGFDEALVGLQAGAEHSFTLQYPEDARRWAGEDAEFHVTLHSVKGKELPPLDDELAQMTSDEYETMEELREAVRQQLRMQREREADYEGQVLDALVEQADIEFPPVMLEQELNDLLQDHDRFFRQQGMPLDDFLRVSGKSLEEYREEQRPHAEQRLRRRLALTELVEQEELGVEETEVLQEIEGRVSGQPDESSDRLRELLRSATGRQLVQTDLLSRKAMRRLVAIASGEPEVETAEPAEADTQGDVSDGAPTTE